MTLLRWFSRQEHSEKPERRWEWIFLILAFVLSVGCVFCATSFSLIWPNQIRATNLLAQSTADYRRDPANLHFAVLDPRLGLNAATDIARLQITPTGNESGQTTIVMLPPTPTAPSRPGSVPLPQPAQTVTPTPNLAPPQPVQPVPTETPALPPHTPTAALASPTGAASTATLPSLNTPTATPIGVLPTPTPVPTATPTPQTAPPKPTLPPPTSVPPPGPTSPPLPTNPPPPTASPTPVVPTTSPTPSPTATSALRITGQVFEDVNYGGGAGSAFGPGDFLLPQVQVELYGGSIFLATTTTDATGRYTFNNVPAGTFTVRVVSSSVGNGDTPPLAGFNPGFFQAVPEQSYEHNGLVGNGLTGALGGNDPAIADPATLPGAGPGDTNTPVTVTTTDVSGVDFGFTYNLVTNTNDGGQGSLRQALLNSNAIAGLNPVLFNIPGPGPHPFQPAAPYPVLTDPIRLDGASQPGYGGTPLIELDGLNLSGGNGLLITAGNSLVRGLIINRFWENGLQLDTNGNNLVTGNYFGTDFTASANRGNGLDAIRITNGASRNVIGGATLGAGNIIAFSGNSGVTVLSGVENTIRGNSIYSNTTLGIDLNGDSVTLNDPGDGDGGPNNQLNFPVLYNAILISGTLTISGEAPPTTTVEIFQVAPDPSGYGQGQTLVETVFVSPSNTPSPTDPAARQFSVAFPVASFGLGDRFSATATDAAGNTSEFSRNVLVTPPPLIITGQLFEDTNHTGGNGSAMDASDVPLANVRVELYDSNGTFLNLWDMTDNQGSYTLNLASLSLGPATYIVRVVSASIGDADTPPAAGFSGLPVTLVAEQSYERDGVAGNGGSGASGGNDPAVSDLSTPTGAGIGDTNVTVVMGTSDLTGVNFGFAYNLVSNSQDNGQGSFRQSLINANAIRGPDRVVFNMLGLAPYTIRPNSPLPALIEPITIDGASQPGAALYSPQVELDGSASGGLDLRGGSSTVQGLIINRTGGSAIELRNLGNNVIQGNFIGTDPSGTAILGGMSNGVRIVGTRGNIIGGSGNIERNLISGASNFGIVIDNLPVSSRVTAGQQVLYTFTEGQGATVNDLSGTGAPLNLTIQDTSRVTWQLRNLTIDNVTLVSANAAAKLFNACTASNEITIEAFVKPTTGTQSGPARIVTYSQDQNNRNFSLAQNGARFMVQLRTTTNGPNGNNVTLSSPSSSMTTKIPTHLVFTRQFSGTASLYLNGLLVDSNVIGGDFSNWDNSFPFGLANEFAGNSSWLGEYHLVSVYCRALSLLEVQNNYLAVGQNYIWKNYIGTDVNGSSALGNNIGINIRDSSNTVVGGYQLNVGNVIAANANDGILLTNSGSRNNLILGNNIGVDRTGNNPLPNRGGISLTNNARNNLIGADFAEAGNIIANSNNGAGIRIVGDNATGNTIRRNAIYANSGLGIDLNDNGVSNNDNNDNDTGPNELLNFPVIYNATVAGPNVTITGEARPGAIVDFFMADSGSGANGEGQFFLGSRLVNSGTPGSDDNSAWQFSVTLPAGPLLPGSSAVTATASDSLGNTSEFARNVGVN